MSWDQIIGIHGRLNGMKHGIDGIEAILEGMKVTALDPRMPLYKRIGEQRRQLRALNRKVVRLEQQLKGETK